MSCEKVNRPKFSTGESAGWHNDHLQPLGCALHLPQPRDPCLFQILQPSKREEEGDGKGGRNLMVLVS